MMSRNGSNGIDRDPLDSFLSTMDWYSMPLTLGSKLVVGGSRDRRFVIHGRFAKPAWASSWWQFCHTYVGELPLEWAPPG
jgi:hypothetical protein